MSVFFYKLFLTVATQKKNTFQYPIITCTSKSSLRRQHAATSLDSWNSWQNVFFYTLGHSKDSQSLSEDLITGAEEEYFSRQQIRELKLDYYHHLLDRKGNEKIATTFLHCSMCTPYLHKCNMYLHCSMPDVPTLMSATGCIARCSYKCNMYARRSYTDECNMAALPDVPTLMSATWLHCQMFLH